MLLLLLLKMVEEIEEKENISGWTRNYVQPSISGRFEAVLSNGETVIVSRKYVNDLKHKLGMWGDNS